ncbi:hypothetical protein IT575_06385 [bacterium]|nr:hypothetical protein [bacterium]
MTRRTLLKIVKSVMWIFAALLVLGIGLRLWAPDTFYLTFKDLIPLGIAIPVAYLSYCYQERASFNRELRTLWAQLIQAQQAAKDYTHLHEPAHSDYAATLSKLSVAIESVRALFKNYSERDGEAGIYPYDSFKDIFRVVRELGHGAEVTDERREAARHEIEALWKKFRSEFLIEMDRDAPASPPSGMANG